MAFVGRHALKLNSIILIVLSNVNAILIILHYAYDGFRFCKGNNKILLQNVCNIFNIYIYVYIFNAELKPLKTGLCLIS